MRQLDRLWKYQAADKKVADYETEIRQFPLRQQLLKLRNIVADQQTVVRGMENDANKALARLEELTAQRDKAEAALEEIKKSLADNAFETAAQVHRAIAQMADAEGKLKSAEKELSKMVSHSQMMENRYKEVRTKAAKARDEYTRLKAGYDKEFEKQTARLEELKQERADAAQGHHAQRVADDRRIDQRIHLLQQKSKQHRDRELPDIPQRLAGRQIMRHGADLLCTYFCHEH